MTLTPATTSMTVLCKTKDAVYLRLPRELQRLTDGCSCPHCTKAPHLAAWDTLVVPLESGEHTWTVHMPDGAVQPFIEYVRRKGA